MAWWLALGKAWSPRADIRSQVPVPGFRGHQIWTADFRGWRCGHRGVTSGTEKDGGLCARFGGASPGPDYTWLFMSTFKRKQPQTVCHLSGGGFDTPWTGFHAVFLLSGLCGAGCWRAPGRKRPPQWRGPAPAEQKRPSVYRRGARWGVNAAHPEAGAPLPHKGSIQPQKLTQMSIPRGQAGRPHVGFQHSAANKNPFEQGEEGGEPPVISGGGGDVG